MRICAKGLVAVSPAEAQAPLLTEVAHIAWTSMLVPRMFCTVPNAVFAAYK